MQTKAQFVCARITLPEQDGGCWEWTGSLRLGYGRSSYRGKTFTAHRVTYEWFVGEIPVGYSLHHLCENKKCCNPSHLVPVLPRHHLLDLTPNGIAYRQVRQTHCKRGHLLEWDNLIPWQLKHRNRRLCRKCFHLNAQRGYYRRKYGKPK